MRLLLMVVRDFHVVGVAAAPAKADAPLLVDANAVLTSPAAGEFLQPVTGRGPQITKIGSGIQYQQLAKCGTLKVFRPASNPLPLVELPGPPVPKTPDHGRMITARVTSDKFAPGDGGFRRVTGFTFRRLAGRGNSVI
jgi:hypothetical protein